MKGAMLKRRVGGDKKWDVGHLDLPPGGLGTSPPKPDKETAGQTSFHCSRSHTNTQVINERNTRGGDRGALTTLSTIQSGLRTKGQEENAGRRPHQIGKYVTNPGTVELALHENHQRGRTFNKAGENLGV